MKNEEGRILIWAIAGLVATAFVISALIGLARLHILRSELTGIGDAATASAAAKLDKAYYFNRGIIGENRTAKIDLERAKATLSQAVTEARSADQRVHASLQNIAITSVSRSSDNVLRAQFQAKAVVLELVSGIQISTTVTCDSQATLKLSG